MKKGQEKAKGKNEGDREDRRWKGKEKKGKRQQER